MALKEPYEEVIKPMRGVFTLSDMRVMYPRLSAPGLAKKIERLISSGELIRVKRGIFAVPSASLAAISARINPDAYVSTNTILARDAIIGSVPARRVQAIKVGRPRLFTCPLGVIEHLSVKPEYYFGYEFRNGQRVAFTEKAFIDACYFKYQQGRGSVDLIDDVNLDRLDEYKVRKFLKPYSIRFRKYISTYWGIQ